MRNSRGWRRPFRRRLRTSRPGPCSGSHLPRNRRGGRGTEEHQGVGCPWSWGREVHSGKQDWNAHRQADLTGRRMGVCVCVWGGCPFPGEKHVLSFSFMNSYFSSRGGWGEERRKVGEGGNISACLLKISVRMTFSFLPLQKR